MKGSLCSLKEFCRSHIDDSDRFMDLVIQMLFMNTLVELRYGIVVGRET